MSVHNLNPVKYILLVFFQNIQTASICIINYYMKYYCLVMIVILCDNAVILKHNMFLFFYVVQFASEHNTQQLIFIVYMNFA